MCQTFYPKSKERPHSYLCSVLFPGRDVLSVCVVLQKYSQASEVKSSQDTYYDNKIGKLIKNQRLILLYMGYNQSLPQEGVVLM